MIGESDDASATKCVVGVKDVQNVNFIAQM